MTVKKEKVIVNHKSTSDSSVWLHNGFPSCFAGHLVLQYWRTIVQTGSILCADYRHTGDVDWLEG